MKKIYTLFSALCLAAAAPGTLSAPPEYSHNYILIFIANLTHHITIIRIIIRNFATQNDLRTKLLFLNKSK